MRFTQMLQSLTVPALAFGAGLTLACADGVPTAPPPTPPMNAIRVVAPQYVDDDGQLGCRTGYTLVFIGLNEPNPYDVNQNAWICKKLKPGEKLLHVDDSSTGACPRGYTPIQVSAGSWGDEYDFNGNDIICQLNP